MELQLSTERLLLRPLEESDADLCAEMFSDPEVMKYVREPRSREIIATEVPGRCRRGAGGCIGIWCILDHATDEKLGTCVLVPLPIDEDDTDWSALLSPDIPPGDIEVGYILKPSAWGRGIATEACRRLLRFAFEETPLEAIVAVTDPDNLASQHVLAKCGFVREGDRRAYNENGIPAFRIRKAVWVRGDA